MKAELLTQTWTESYNNINDNNRPVCVTRTCGNIIDIMCYHRYFTSTG